MKQEILPWTEDEFYCIIKFYAQLLPVNSTSKKNSHVERDSKKVGVIEEVLHTDFCKMRVERLGTPCRAQTLPIYYFLTENNFFLVFHFLI